MTKPTFTHLEVHSHYTLLGATPSVAQLVNKASAEHMTHLALTDSNALYGAVTFDRACRAAGVQPILGMTVTAAPPSEEAGIGLAVEPGHLVLIANGPAGYRSLCRLSALIQGSPEREALATRGLDWQALKDNAQGLICLSGGYRSWIDRFLRDGNRPAAVRYVARLGGIYGEQAYLSLEIHQSDDIQLAHEITALAQRFGLGTVAAQPVYYLDAADVTRLRLLKAIDRNCPLEEVTEDLTDRHWLQKDEMSQRFAAFPEALDQVSQLAAHCGPALPDGRPIWPALRLPQDQTPEQALAQQAKAGLVDRYKPDVPIEASQRLEVELDAIANSGYAPLFVIVADVVRFARQKEIPVSTRGSVANSLVAYCTGITTVDPMVHDLLFERFLNPARANPPDIDLDFCSRRRDEVLNYVRTTYGPDQVALVATISTLRPKSAVRETAKAYGLEEKEISLLVKRLPRDWHPDPRRRSRRTVADLIEELDDTRQQLVVEAAGQIVGQPHHLSIHPGGVVITPGPLTDFVPVQWAPKGFLITQFGHQDLETLGLPKLDLLGIRALTVLADAAELVRQHHDPGFHLDAIPLDDTETGDMLARGDTIGVFQCDSAGAQRTLRQLQARSVFDLAVANAFFKPGPATGGMAPTFIRRYRGQETVSFLHPTLEPILASTKGVLLFQEQILRVATEIAGLSWEQADHLRRGMSKFQAQEMAALQTQFVAGCCRPAPDGPEFSSKQAETLWEQVLAFAGYGFNRGHATAYADVSYRSAFLKNHWPAAFFCARLADWGGFHHPAVYTAEAIRQGIAIRPPHINHSNRAFTLTYGASSSSQSPVPDPPSPILWMGLGQIRDLRRASVKAIIAGRADYPFCDLADLVERVPLQAKEVNHLIQCGALDGLGSSRSALLAKAQTLRQAGSTRQMHFAFATPEVTSETAAERLAWERTILGRPVSVHPLELVKSRPGKVTALSQLPKSAGRPVTVAGVRLPGWTGGPGFFLGDAQTYVVARGDKSLKAPEPWLPLKLRGRWTGDEWGTRWFQIEELWQL